MRHRFDDAALELPSTAMLADADEPRHDAPLTRFVFAQTRVLEPTFNTMNEAPVTEAGIRHADWSQRSIARIQEHIGGKRGGRGSVRLGHFDTGDVAKAGEQLVLLRAGARAPRPGTRHGRLTWKRRGSTQVPRGREAVPTTRPEDAAKVTRITVAVAGTAAEGRIGARPCPRARFGAAPR